MMDGLNWKKAAKAYREVLIRVMVARQALHELLIEQDKVISAAQFLVEIEDKPKNPFVKLLGEDINIIRAKKSLRNSLENYSKFIQTYSQEIPQNSPEEKLDNDSVV